MSVSTNVRVLRRRLAGPIANHLTGASSRLAPRQRMAVAGWILLSLGLVPALAAIGPVRPAVEPLLLVTIYTLAIVADRSDVPLPGGVRFDATIALMLVCIALAGPLPALGVYLAPAIVNGITGRERFLRLNTIGNFASAGWQAVAASIALGLLAGVPVLALLAAGAALFYVGWAIAPAVYAPLWLGVPLRRLVGSLRDMHAAAFAMVALGSLTVLVHPAAGLLALLAFALVAVLPQSALTYAARELPVARLDTLTAARRYAAAIGVHLRMDRAARREVDVVVCLAHARDVEGDALDHLIHATIDRSEASCAAGHVTEWWNGAGGPAGVPGTLIPVTARVAAVARTWAALTAEGSPQLSHREAVAHLEDAAGIRLDPRVVRAARVVMRQERATAAVPAPEPRMHRLHVPAGVRRALAAAV